MTTTTTPARLRVLQAITRKGLPPSNTRIDMLSRMRDAGLIAPLPDRNEPWRITAKGRDAIEAAEAAQGRAKVNGLLSDLLD